MLGKLRSEDQLYDEILSRVPSLLKGNDVREFQTYIELMGLYKNGLAPNTEVIRNCLLLLLSFSSHSPRGFELWGTDVQNLHSAERNSVYAQVWDALPDPDVPFTMPEMATTIHSPVTAR